MKSLYEKSILENKNIINEIERFEKTRKLIILVSAIALILSIIMTQ